MAASMFFEQESGTSTGRIHPHNGYYAGDFSAPRATRRPAVLRGSSVPRSLVRPGLTGAWDD